jgi:hypothetical protein
VADTNALAYFAPPSVTNKICLVALTFNFFRQVLGAYSSGVRAFEYKAKQKNLAYTNALAYLVPVL